MPLAWRGQASSNVLPQTFDYTSEQERYNSSHERLQSNLLLDFRMPAAQNLASVYAWSVPVAFQ